MFNSIDILGVRISAVNIPLAVNVLATWIRERAKAYVCVAPVSTIVDCQKDPDYKAVINGAKMVTPDGMPVVWLGKLKGNKVIGRTYGPDLLPAVCDASQDQGFSHYFYGGSEETNARLLERLRAQFPKLKVAGSFAPAFKQVGEIEDKEVIDQINTAKPDILWVGLGSPKQDYWMFNHRDKLDAPVIVGVGAAFDFLSGVKKQAPRWMQRSGLEWLFRLASEPGRLWKRYLVGNTLFVYFLLRQLIKQSLSR